MNSAIVTVTTTASPLVDQVHRTMHWVDYVVFSLFLSVSLGIGIYFAFAGDRQRTAKEFLTGNRSLSLVPVAVSILVSFTSAILILGAPAELYLNGTMYLLYTIGKVIAIILASLIFVPLFYPLKLTSSFEYLELRFESKAVRILGNLFYILSSILYMGIAMYAPSAAMDFCSGGSFNIYMSHWDSLHVLGGIKAVVWTDVFQAGIMLIGIFAIIIKGTIDVGGPANVWAINEKYGRIQFDEFSFDPTVRHTFWGLTIGSAVGWLGTYGVNQAAVQRYCALPNISKARQSLWINIPGAMILTWTASAAGMVIFAYYQYIGCDINGIGWARGKNDIVPYYVMDQLGQYYSIPGLFVASLFAGALSSVSSSLNACAAITWKDILEPLFFKDASETKSGWINRILTLIFGILGTGFGFIAINLGGTVLQASLSFTGAVGAPSLGLFIMGAFIPIVNKYGAFVGAVAGLAINMWVSIGSYSAGNQEISLPGNTSMCNVPRPTMGTFSTNVASPLEASGLQKFYQLSYLWYTLFGLLVTVILGVLVSLITNLIWGYKRPDHKYVVPLVHKLCCCFPMGCQEFTSCGIDIQARDEFEYAAEEEDKRPNIVDVELTERPSSAGNKVAPMPAAGDSQQPVAGTSSSSPTPTAFTASTDVKPPPYERNPAEPNSKENPDSLSVTAEAV
uniref:Sodium-coupled monocarboxylate transporter 1 n=3 Tax=Macrostomum lignano TaxID=282301 RepID=A0A1I8I2K6_9PLAT